MKYFTRVFFSILVLGLFSTCTLFIDIQDPPPTNNVNNVNNTNNTNNIEPVCGNEVLEEGEECDDGNTTSGDGCSADCKVECGPGLTDCEDPRCADDPACNSCLQVGSSCTTGADCCSSICSHEGICVSMEICDDGIDNNGNGLTDCEDPQCWANTLCPCREIGDSCYNHLDCCSQFCLVGTCKEKEICDNGIDDTGNGLTDCADPDCADDPLCQSVEPVCGNSILEEGEDCEMTGETTTCSQLGYSNAMTLVCQDCTWNVGNCEPWQGVGVGEGCTSNTVCTGVHLDHRECNVSFPGGYCTRQCNSEGYDVCIGSGGRCLCMSSDCKCFKPCTTTSQCRTADGYHCAAPMGYTEQFCIPPGFPTN